MVMAEKMSDEAIKLAYSEGASTRSIAAVAGCHAETVRQRLLSLGVQMRPKTTGLSKRIYESRLPEDRFWEKVQKGSDDECWPWIGSLNARTGYGQFSSDSDGRKTDAHVFSFRLSGRSIPAGLDLDHLCRNRPCVNPRHLEPVTRRENVLRGVGIAAQNARKTHCKRGHEFTAENTRRTQRGRSCRECERAALRGSRSGQ